METSSGERNPVEQLAEEFLARKRRGEQPTLAEYIARYPDLAQDIRELFPALLLVEDLGDGSLAATGPHTAADAIAALPAPQQLGDFRILRKVGHGGMGVVYEAEQQSLGRRVALKVLPAHALTDPQKLRRFEREARSAARLHHTNIVPVFGVGQWRAGDRSPPVHYYVMQFIQGRGLDEVLAELQRLRRTKGRPEEAPPVKSDKDLSAVAVAQALLTEQFAPASGGRQPPGDGSPANPQPLPEEERSADAEHRGAHAPRSPDTPARPSPIPRSTYPASPNIPPYRRPAARTGRAWPASACRWPRPWPTPTARASCTATSSRLTCCSTCTARCGSPISAWPRRPPTATT